MTCVQSSSYSEAYPTSADVSAAVYAIGAADRPPSAQETLRRHLRSLSAQERDDIANKAGIHQRKLRSFRDGERGVTNDEFVRAMAAAGEKAVNAVLGTVGYGGAHKLTAASSLPDLGVHLTKSAAAIFAANDPASEDGTRLSRKEKAGIRDWLLATGSKCFAVAAQLAKEIGS